MQIDVIIATYNRAAMLEHAVRSVLAARRAPEFDYTITVIDNNSTDATRETIARLVEESGGRVRYMFEPRQGKSYAVNTGMAVASGDVIAFADDDQVMDIEWLSAIHRAMADGYDYVTGRVLGVWEVDPPAWYDDRLCGVISVVDLGVERIPHKEIETRQGFSGCNAAVRRAAVEQVGGYHLELGKLTGSFAMNEDGE